VAPDYILCERSVKDTLVTELIREIKVQLGDRPLSSESYGRMVSEKHFARVRALIDEKKVVFGGESDPISLKIAPTVMDGVTWEDAVMGEEIFGPLLPILTFERFEEVIPLLQGKQKPLALYLFSENAAHVRAITERLSFGGGCINDVIIHLATSEMGFGGVGESGMGAYHGKAGFNAFSHRKSIVDKKTMIDLPMRYRPYRKGGLFEKLLRIFLK